MPKAALYLGYAALIILATLNRNSSIVLVAAYAAVMWPRRKERAVMVWGLIYLGLWAGVYGWIVLTRRAPGEWITPATVLAGNLSRWGYEQSIPYNLALLPIWAVAFINRRRAPLFLQRLLWIIPLYLAPVLVYGMWHEVRLWLTLIPLLLPLAVWKPKP